MMSPNVTLPIEEKGADVDGVEQEGGAAEFDYLNQNYASLLFMVVVSMAHVKVK